MEEDGARQEKNRAEHIIRIASGTRFGRLTVIGDAGVIERYKKKRGYTWREPLYLCRCVEAERIQPMGDADIFNSALTAATAGMRSGRRITIL